MGVVCCDLCFDLQIQFVPRRMWDLQPWLWVYNLQLYVPLVSSAQLQFSMYEVENPARLIG